MNKDKFEKAVDSFFKLCQENIEYKDVIVNKIVEKDTEIALNDMEELIQHYRKYNPHNIEDISDFENIYSLVKNSQFNDTRNAVYKLDTIPRENIPESVIKWFEHCRQLEKNIFK